MTEMENKWAVPPGLKRLLDYFDSTCDVFLEEDEETQKKKPLMICGPTGVGKSLFVDFFIHKYQMKYPKNNKVLKINCAAIPETLLESEMFGYRKGSHSTAKTDKPGFLEMAEDGILVFEEIGEMPLNLQAKLLIAIETKLFFRLGDSKARENKAQIIATTNKQKQDFRLDFWYRFTHFFITPLHKRRIDIPYYFFFIDDELAKEFTTGNMLSILSYNWPGNVREIENVIRQIRINKKYYIKKKTPTSLDDEGIELEVTFLDQADLFKFKKDYVNIDFNKPEAIGKKLRLKVDENDKINTLLSHFRLSFDIDSEPFFGELYATESILIKDQDYDSDQFVKLSCDLYDCAYIGFCVMCFLFFQNEKVDYDILDFKEFCLSDIDAESLMKKALPKEVDQKEYEGIHNLTIKYFAGGVEYGEHNNIPLNSERNKLLRELLLNNKDNIFLNKLFDNDDYEKLKVNTLHNITSISEDELKKMYYENLLWHMNGVQKRVAKVAGKKEGTITTILKKYGLNKEIHDSSIPPGKRIIILE